MLIKEVLWKRNTAELEISAFSFQLDFFVSGQTWENIPIFLSPIRIVQSRYCT